MAFPTEPTEPITEIATDTNYDVPGEDWDGQPTKVAPPTGVETQGYVPGTPRPADVDNWLFNMIAKWLAYLVAYVEELRTTYLAGLASSTANRIPVFADTTGKVLAQSTASIASGVVTAPGGFVFGGVSGVYSYSTARTRDIPISPNDIVIESGDSHSRSLVSAGSFIACGTNSMQLRVDLTKHLQPGMTITGLRLAVDPGAARTGGNRMSLAIYKRVVLLMSGTATQVGTTDFDDETASAQELEVDGLTEDFDPLYHYTAVIKAGHDTATNPDQVGGLLLAITQTQVW